VTFSSPLIEQNACALATMEGMRRLRNVTKCRAAPHVTTCYLCLFAALVILQYQTTPVHCRALMNPHDHLRLVRVHVTEGVACTILTPYFGPFCIHLLSNRVNA
jgi:hypothetical protein